MTADLIIYAIVAAALVFWLRSILGTRNGNERDRGNPFSPRNDNKTTPDDVIDIPSSPNASRPTTDVAPMRVTKTTLVNRVRIETPNAEAGLRSIAAADPTFNLDRFMDGAETAFEMIVVAFAKGDKNTLRTLLTPSVYNDFEGAINDRATRGETVETKIEGIRAMDIITAQMRGNTAFVSIRFTVQEICVIRNAAGMVTSGDPEKTTTMIDIWTYGRDVTSNTPVWYLYETRDEMAEDHKTPLPESHTP